MTEQEVDYIPEFRRFVADVERSTMYSEDEQRALHRLGLFAHGMSERIIQQAAELRKLREELATAKQNAADANAIADHLREREEELEADCLVLREENERLRASLELLEDANKKIGKQLLEHSDEVNSRGDQIDSLRTALKQVVEALDKHVVECRSMWTWSHHKWDAAEGRLVPMTHDEGCGRCADLRTAISEAQEHLK